MMNAMTSSPLRITVAGFAVWVGLVLGVASLHAGHDLTTTSRAAAAASMSAAGASNDPWD